MCLYGKVGLIKDFVSVYQLHSKNLLLTQKNDLKLIVNSIDGVIEPYKLAIKLNLFSYDELEKWKKQVLVFDMIYILTIVLIFQDENYAKLLVYLKGKDADVLEKVQKTLRFKIILFLYRIRLLRIFINLLKIWGIF